MIKTYKVEDITDVMINKAENLLSAKFKQLEEISQYNLRKVLWAMKNNRLSDVHFNWNTGYGYDDIGRDTTECIFADVFGAEDAIVRPQIASGTHALSLMIMGLVLPQQTIVSITGAPYDTLHPTFGIVDCEGVNLKKIGAIYRQVELKNGDFDEQKIMEEIEKKPEYVYIQRSAGYSWRSHIDVQKINLMVRKIKAKSPKTMVLLDNCYGEFTEMEEPNVDVLAGSLIKNAGGGLVVGGGYLVGKKELITKISERLTAPGIGKEIGLMFGQTRNILQGLFMAPSVVKSAMMGAYLFGEVFEQLGYQINPTPRESNGHIIQAIQLESEEKLLNFCKAIQASAPVNAYVTPLPAPMPGYVDDVIMAAGCFVQGSSIEMSADGPVKPPYIVYFQGGLCYEHVKIALEEVLRTL